MRPLRSIADAPTLASAGRVERLVAALETVTVLGVELAPGAPPTDWRRADVEGFLFVLDGEATVEDRSAEHAAAAGTLVHLPAGTVHRLGSRGAADTRLLCLLVPGVAPGEPLFVPVADGQGDTPAGGASTSVSCIPLDLARFEAGRRAGGFAVQTLAGPDPAASECVTGGCVVNAALVAAGGAGPQMHLHSFDQLFVILRGGLRVDVAGWQVEATVGDVVVLPAGVPHTQWNEGDIDELHLAVLVPPPPAGEPVTLPVEFRRR